MYLGGHIPTELGSMTKIEEWFNMNGCALSGHIPTELGSLPIETELDLSYNRLTGTVPTEFGRMEVIYHHFRLDANSLSGTVPTEFGMMTAMETNFKIHLNEELCGDLPTQIGVLSSTVSCGACARVLGNTGSKRGNTGENT